jgi:hypothetical protein
MSKKTELAREIEQALVSKKEHNAHLSDLSAKRDALQEEIELARKNPAPNNSVLVTLLDSYIAGAIDEQRYSVEKRRIEDEGSFLNEREALQQAIVARISDANLQGSRAAHDLERLRRAHQDASYLENIERLKKVKGFVAGLRELAVIAEVFDRDETATIDEFMGTMTKQERQAIAERLE